MSLVFQDMPPNIEQASLVSLSSVWKPKTRSASEELSDCSSKVQAGKSAPKSHKYGCPLGQSQVAWQTVSVNFRVLACLSLGGQWFAGF